MSKNCIITTVKSKIKGNATSYIEKENEIFIPISKKFTLNQTRAMAQDKVNKINKEYLSPKFGEVVSLNSSYTDGTGINIHPSQRLIDAYEVKEGNKTIEQVNSNRDLEYFNEDEALLEQEQNEDNLIQKELDNLIKQTNSLNNDILFQKQTQSSEGQIASEGKQLALFNLSEKPTEKKLIDGFLSDFGITVREYENLKDEIGLDAYAASDLITKSIAYQKGESILPEVAYFAYSMLGKQNNKLRSELRYLINKWNKYKERFDYHAKIVKDKEGFIKNSEEWKNKIRDLVIIDFLQENLNSYYLNKKEFNKVLDTIWTREDFSLWNKIISMIEDFLSDFSDKYKSQKEKLENIGLSIADEIINRNY